MNKVIPLFAFSVLLLVPAGAQSAFANPGNTEIEFLGPSPIQPTTHTNYLITDPDGLLEFSTQFEQNTPLGCIVATTFSVSNTALPLSLTLVDCETDGDTTTWELTATGVTCISGSCLPQVIGGKLLPLDTTALLLAGAQMNAAWIVPLALSVIGIGVGIYLVKRRF